jgi:hypothetical protein
MNVRASKRRGYALTLVIIFLVLFLAMLGMAYRQTAAVLRVETVRSVQTRRDQGCLLAAVQCIHYLETATSPTSPQVFTVNGFPNTFTVTFSQDLVDHTVWTITAVPTQ